MFSLYQRTVYTVEPPLMSQGRLAAPPARKVTSLASTLRPEPEPPVGSGENKNIA